MDRRAKGHRDAPAPVAEKTSAVGIKPWSRSQATTAVIVCALLLVLILTALASTHLLSHRDLVVANHQRELKNIALVLSENASQNLSAFDRLLSQLIAKNGLREASSREEMQARFSGTGLHWDLRNAISGIPFVTEIGLIDEQGDLINHSGSWPPAAVNFADREHFQTLQADPASDAAISGPVRSRTTGEWVIAFARRIQGENGKFRGILGGVIRLAHFEQFFESVTLGEGATIAFVRMDGTLLVRHPRLPSSIGNKVATSQALPDIFAQRDHLELRRHSPLDGEDRIIAIRKVPEFPVAIAVSLASENAFADWRREAVFVLALTAAIAFAIGLGAFVSVRHLVRQQRRSDREIEEHKLLLGMALDNMSQGLCMFDADSRLILCNQRYLDMYSLPPDIVKPGCTLATIIDERKKTNTFEGDTTNYVDEVRGLVTEGKQAQRLVESPDGRVIRLVHQPMPNGAWVATHEDITLQRRAEQERDRNRDFLNLVVENIPVTTVVKDAHDLSYVFVNRAGERYYATTRDQMIGKTPFDILPGPSAQLVTDLDRQMLAANRGPISDEHQIRMADGSLRVARSTRLPIPDEKGDPQYVLAVIEDITERKQAEERIAHLAHHDALTNLPNRLLFRSQLELSMSQLRESEHLALLYLDIDHFKSINDTLGHPIGDELLKAVAGRLRRCTQVSDTVARLGGDEFALIHTAIKHPHDCIPLLNTIYELIRAPYELDGHHVLADVSIGIAIAPGDGTEPDELLKNADLALYGAKAEGRGTYRFFEFDMDARMKERRSLELDLRKAILNGEFELHYQPILKVMDGSIAGCEALLRWRHPVRGLVMPGEFISIAEETGLINQIGEWVLRQACTDAKTWPEHIKVSINLSPAQFRSRSLVQTIFNSFATAGLRADRLELEITETVLMQQTETTVEMLQQLRRLGVRIAIDDFGTGFSSLSYLRSFPISKLKIDRSFVQDLPHDTDAMAIVRAVVGLANSLGIVSTAEGVETDEQLQALSAIGCSEMQGFLIGVPQPAAQIGRCFPARKFRATSAA